MPPPEIRQRIAEALGVDGSALEPDDDEEEEDADRDAVTDLLLQIDKLHLLAQGIKAEVDARKAT